MTNNLALTHTSWIKQEKLAASHKLYILSISLVQYKIALLKWTWVMLHAQTFRCNSLYIQFTRTNCCYTLKGTPAAICVYPQGTHARMFPQRKNISICMGFYCEFDRITKGIKQALKCTYLVKWCLTCLLSFSVLVFSF